MKIKLFSFVLVHLFAWSTFCDQNTVADGCYPIVEVGRLVFANCHSDDMKQVAEIISEQTDVVTIDISNIGFQSIDAIDLRQNRVLKNFHAAYNKLEAVPTKCLRTAPTIEMIDLSSNRLKRVEMANFEDNIKLSLIDLSFNSIDSIEKDAFLSLKHLTYVDLGSNKIAVLHPMQFCSECVVSLHVQNNTFYELNSETFRLEENISIYVLWVQFRYIDFQVQKGRFNVILNDKSDKIVAIPDENYQHEIHCGEQSLTNIENILIADNQMENVSVLLQCLGSSIQLLSLSGNALGSLNQTTFARFTNLKNLLIANTQLVEFDFSEIAGYKLETLDISNNNQLKSISNVSKLKKFGRLTYFDAAGNHLQNTPEIFQSLSGVRLMLLNLSGNFIGALNKTTFERVSNLMTLRLSNTKISFNIDFNPFERLHQLLVLDISDNNFETANFAVIADTMKKLRSFLASNCKIQNVSNVIQHLGNGIEHLDLSRNTAGDLSANLFEPFSKLRTFNLSHSNIKHFGSDTIKYLIDIQNFDISMNQLRELDCYLVPLGIKELHINNNRLKRITNLNGERFSTLNKLDIADNCLAAEYVQKIRDNLTGINFLTDPRKQKSKEECNAHYQQITHPNKSQASTIVIVVVSVVILVIVCVCFVYRKKLFGKIKTAFQTTTEQNLYQTNQSDITTTTEIVTKDEPIYEELDEYVKYDKLWHEFQPMPLSKETQETYNTTDNSSISEPANKLGS